MLNPVQARLVIGPSILGRFNYPVAWEGTVGVPINEVVGAFNHDERRDTLAVGINALDHGNLFAITRLDLLSLSGTIGTGYDYYRRDLAYHKASLVKVVDVLVLDAVLSL